MRTSLTILWNSLLMALRELRVNKLRTFLSLLGITIGIFCIISVFTLTKSLERNVRDQVNSLGTNVVYLQKWPWGGGGEYPWWKYLTWPRTRYQEMNDLAHRVHSASHICFFYDAGGQTVESGDSYMDGLTLMGFTYDFGVIQNLELAAGRYFTPMEMSSYHPELILGASTWQGLFPTAQAAIGKTVTLNGRPLRVIGCLNQYGQGIVNAFNYDDAVLLPYPTARSLVSDNNLEGTIIAEAAPGVSVERMRDDLRGAMRAIRHLSPTQEDNFSLNEISLLSGSLDKIFGSINSGGVAIGIFALIVGAFGIANIMFVTVKERTPQIGLKKAIGARRGAILQEFLLESILLCLIGGVLGIGLVYLLTQIIVHAVSFTIVLTPDIVVLGLSISVITGMVAGFIPAYSAARLDPVTAIRS